MIRGLKQRLDMTTAQEGQSLSSAILPVYSTYVYGVNRYPFGPLDLDSLWEKYNELTLWFAQTEVLLDKYRAAKGKVDWNSPSPKAVKAKATALNSINSLERGGLDLSLDMALSVLARGGTDAPPDPANIYVPPPPSHIMLLSEAKSSIEDALGRWKRARWSQPGKHIAVNINGMYGTAHKDKTESQDWVVKSISRDNFPHLRTWWMGLKKPDWVERYVAESFSTGKGFHAKARVRDGFSPHINYHIKLA